MNEEEKAVAVDPQYQERIEQASTEVREQMDLEGATPNEKAIGKFLLIQFKDPGMRLAEAFIKNECRLNAIWADVHKEAKEYLNGKDGIVSDETVFGWVCDIILGTKGSDVKTEKKPVKPVKRPSTPAPKKPKEEKGYEQMSIFDLGVIE